MNNSKALPPLIKHIGFVVDATILSYYGYEIQVLRLLMELNTNAHLYLITHVDKIDKFIKETPSLIYFGN